MPNTETTGRTYADGLRRAAKICGAMIPDNAVSPVSFAIQSALEDVQSECEREAANAE